MELLELPLVLEQNFKNVFNDEQTDSTVTVPSVNASEIEQNKTKTASRVLAFYLEIILHQFCCIERYFIC